MIDTLPPKPFEWIVIYPIDGVICAFNDLGLRNTIEVVGGDILFEVVDGDICMF